MENGPGIVRPARRCFRDPPAQGALCSVAPQARNDRPTPTSTDSLRRRHPVVGLPAGHGDRPFQRPGAPEGGGPAPESDLTRNEHPPGWWPGGTSFLAKDFAGVPRPLKDSMNQYSGLSAEEQELVDRLIAQEAKDNGDGPFRLDEDMYRRL